MPLLAMLATIVLAADPEPCATHIGLGPTDAPIEVEMYADPVRPGLATLWLEVRRLVADHGGELAIRFHAIRPPGREDPELDSVRHFFVAAASQRAVRLPHQVPPSNASSRSVPPS